ncbi:MAG: DUF4399 domain-containing protein [Pseudomonadota bacterium]
MKNTIATMAAFAAFTGFAVAGETPSPEGAAVYFINIEDGATVSSPFKVKFGLSGMGVAPAGADFDKTGHHHVLVNRAPYGEGPNDGEMSADGLYNDENHRHFGGGQTEAVFDLPAGTHTLQMVLGDQFHIPHDPPVMSEQITVTVE